MHDTHTHTSSSLTISDVSETHTLLFMLVPSLGSLKRMHAFRVYHHRCHRHVAKMRIAAALSTLDTTHLKEKHNNDIEWKCNTTRRLHTESLTCLAVFHKYRNHYPTFWRSLGGSVQDKKKVKNKHNSDHIQTMAFPPTTVSQRQC